MTPALLSGEASREQDKMARGHLPTHWASPRAKAAWASRRLHNVSSKEEELFRKKQKPVNIKENEALCKELVAFYRSFPCKKKKSKYVP